MFDLPEKITVWTPGSNDGTGTKSYNGPFVIDARFALKQEKFTDKNGDTQISKAVCYAEDPILIADGAIVLLAESAANTPPAGSDDVRAHTATPSATDMKKAWL